ncbi:V-type ATPase assembly factor pkr1 [Yarrowia sp. B02]|nr:V-type ATPase assembly factor pkr1 [Yarrowia sp. B02]
MGYFVVDLWESIFTPGTTPTLVKATHGSFVLLILSLLFLMWNALNIHTVMLLIIALCLWGTLTWFIGEVAKLKAEGKLKSDEQLKAESEAKETKKEQ